MKVHMRASRIQKEGEECTILTFLNFDNGKDKPRVRVDCIFPFKANVTAEKHRQEGYLELQDSRSRSLVVKDNDSIRVFLKGNIQLPKGVPKAICILKFFKQASSNHITFPVERVHSQSYFGEIEYSTKKFTSTHNVRFDLKKKHMRNLFKAKAKHHNKGSVLSERSLAVLGRQLQWGDWERVGLGLGLHQDLLDDLIEEADRRPVRLLTAWIAACEGRNEAEMVEELTTVLEDNGHGQAANIIRKVIIKNRDLQVRDF